MKTKIKFSTEITNPTLKHLADWIEALKTYLKGDDAFQDIDSFSTQLEQWRSEFCAHAEVKYHWGDLVTVMTYGESTILISDQRSGEFICIEAI